VCVRAGVCAFESVCVCVCMCVCVYVYMNVCVYMCASRPLRTAPAPPRACARRRRGQTSTPLPHCRCAPAGEGIGELNKALADALKPGRLQQVQKKGAAATHVVRPAAGKDKGAVGASSSGGGSSSSSSSSSSGGNSGLEQGAVELKAVGGTWAPAGGEGYVLPCSTMRSCSSRCFHAPPGFVLQCHGAQLGARHARFALRERMLVLLPSPAAS